MKRAVIRFFAVGLCLLVLLGTTGCGARVEEPTPTPPPPEPVDFVGVLQADELGQLDSYQNLRSADLSGSDCYAEIEAFIAAHPDVNVRYTVSIGGTAYAPDTKELDIRDAVEWDDLLKNGAYLHELESVWLRGDLLTHEHLDQLAAAFPALDVQYDVPFFDDLLERGTEVLNLSWIKTREDVEEAAEVLSFLPNIKRVTISDELSFEEYAILKAAAFQADFDYNFTLFGQEVNTFTESLSFRRMDVGEEETAMLAEMLPYLENLKELRFEKGEIDNEAMAELRDKFPDKEIVWRVNMVGHFMSDAISIWLIGGYNDKQLEPLKYCTKAKYVDVGHNGFSDIDFLYYMPDLEVLILENTHVSDLTAVASCKKLEYLECGENWVTDITPLAGCTELVHLNIGRLHELTDISPLYGLTKLECLYGKCCENVPPEQVEHMRELLPDCEICFDDDPIGPIWGTWRYKNGKIVPRYQLLHDQLGYDW